MTQQPSQNGAAMMQPAQNDTPHNFPQVNGASGEEDDDWTTVSRKGNNSSLSPVVFSHVKIN